MGWILETTEWSFFDGSDSGNVITLPDITLWSTDDIVCNEEAYTVLKNKLDSYGEWLPILIEGVSYWLLHVTKKTGMDFVDLNKSERIVDRVGDIEVRKLTFYSEKIEELLILKTEYNNYKNIYCTEAFKSLLEENDLKGMIFSEDMTNSPY